MVASRRRQKKLAVRKQAGHGMVTRSKSLRASQGAVLDTVELFEKVMEYLSVQDLVRYRAVNQLWKKIIDKSLPLQQALFLKPLPNRTTWINEEGTNSLRAHTKGGPREKDLVWVDRQRQCVPTKINPVLLRRDHECATGKIPVRIRFLRAESMTMVKTPDLSNLPKVRDLRDNMFICNPPTREVKIELACRKQYLFKPADQPSQEERWITVQRDAGVRWKDIRRELRKRLTPAGQDVVNFEGFELDRVATKVWAIGVVAYNQAEAKAIDDGEERNPKEEPEPSLWRVV